MGLMFDQMRQQGSQLPQQNQYLQSNPSTDSNANTSWMSPNQQSGSSNPASQSPVQNQQMSMQNPNQGTALGAVQAGNVGQYAPQGYDQGKFNDPNKHDPKYDIGRILSKYPPNNAGLQAAGPELQQMGYRVDGKDGIIGPDGIRVDVGQGFSAAAANGGNGNWWWNPQDGGGMMNNNSQMLGGNGQQQQGGMFSPQMMQQLFAMLQGNSGGMNIRQPNQTSNYFNGGQPGGAGQQGNQDMGIGSFLTPQANTGLASSGNTGFAGGKMRMLDGGMR